MMEWVQKAAVVFSALISLGTVVTVTLPSLRKKWRRLTSPGKHWQEKLERLCAILEKHVAEEEERKKELAQQKEVDLCVLRDLITTTYYRYADEKKIPVYAMEDVSALYELYAKRGGNSYVQSLVRQIQDEWEIVA